MTDGILSPRKDTPLWWLYTHHGLKLSEDKELVEENNSLLDLFLDPPVASESLAMQPEPAELPEPLPFSPEPLPYSTVAPSQLAEKEKVTGEDEDDPNGRAKGAIAHRILEHLGRERPLPETAAVVAALVGEGVSEIEAEPLAMEILQEVELCLREKFFSWLLSNKHPQAYCEWSLEDRPAADQIRSGTVDRVVFDGTNWWVVDYKTGRPSGGEKVDDFLQRQARRYRAQLLAYGEMIANYFNVDVNTVRPVFYFTALQRKVELDLTN